MSRKLVFVCFALGLVLLSMVPAQDALASPTVSFAGPVTLTAPATVSFSQAVGNVNSEDLVVRAATTVAATLSCRNGTGGTTPCSGMAVRTVIIKPRASLIPGERYTIYVNPAGSSSSIMDQTLTPLPQTARTFIASRYEEENSARAAYQWRTFSSSQALGGSYQGDYLRGSGFSFSFVGSSVTWYTVMSPSQGLAQVTLDGRNLGTVNNYSPTVHFKVARRYRGLATTRHRLQVRVLGQLGSSAGTGRWIMLDGLAVSNVLVAAPPVVFSWQAVVASGASGGRYVRAMTPGASVSFVFRGGTIDWITQAGPTQGTAKMYIDGVLRQIADLHSSVTRYQYPRRMTGLSDAVHTLKIVTGSGTVSVDRFIVRLPDVSMYKGLGTWVDLFDYSSLDPATAASDMHAHGVRTIFIETARFNSSSAFDYPTELGAWIEAAHANHMKIVGWYFPAYGTYLSTDISRTVAIAGFRSPNHQAFDGLAIDIEYKTSAETRANWFADIAKHLSRVRSGAGMAYSIGAIVPAPLAMDLNPSLWTDFPWKAIGAYANVVVPMGYWSYRTDCATNPAHCAYGYSVGNVKEARQHTGLLVHLIGGIGDKVTASQVADFIRGAKDGAAYGASLYDYRTTASSFWTALAGANSL
ncbi:MAG: Ig-like domain-containing protein [Actinomycetota bacterium]